MIVGRKEKLKMKKKKEEINVTKLNEVISLSQKILKMTIIFFGIVGLYAITLIIKEWQVLGLIFKILNILIPLFIGLLIAWLLEPIIRYLKEKGVNRTLGAVLVYMILLSVFYFTFTGLIPLFLQEINDFLRIMPTILTDTTNWLNRFLEGFKEIEIIDITVIRNDVINYLNTLLSSITTEIPMLIINFVKNFFSFIGVFIIGLMIGFYLLISFNNLDESFLNRIPIKNKNEIITLFKDLNNSLFSYLKGEFLIAVIVFVGSTLILYLIGVEAPLLLGFICGVTNLIPYIGPFIGGGLAAIVGFTQTFSIGILVIIFITGFQSLESIILRPLVMSKTMRLHPVTVLTGLLIFGYFFGIIGLIIATPLVAMFKTISVFILKKYNVFEF